MFHLKQLKFAQVISKTKQSTWKFSLRCPTQLCKPFVSSVVLTSHWRLWSRNWKCKQCNSVMEQGCQKKWRLPCGTGTVTESLVEIPNIQPAENQDWSLSLLDEFGLLVGHDESEPVELVGVGLQALDLRIHLHWFGWRPCLDVFGFALLCSHW